MVADPLEELRRRALTVRALYGQLEQRTWGRSWTREELLLTTSMDDLEVMLRRRLEERAT